MAVEVIVRRGLEIDVDRWLDRYVRRLAELPTARADIRPDQWRSALGVARRLPDWTAYFRRELRERPWHDRAGRVVAAPAARHRGRLDARGDPGRPRRTHPARQHVRMSGADRDPRRARPRAGLLGSPLPRAARRRGTRWPARRGRGAARRRPAARPERLHRTPARPGSSAVRVGVEPARAAAAGDGGGRARRARVARRRCGGVVPRAGSQRTGAARAHRHGPERGAARATGAAFRSVGAQPHRSLGGRRSRDGHLRTGPARAHRGCRPLRSGADPRGRPAPGARSTATSTCSSSPTPPSSRTTAPETPTSSPRPCTSAP